MAMDGDTRPLDGKRQQTIPLTALGMQIGFTVSNFIEKYTIEQSYKAIQDLVSPYIKIGETLCEINRDKGPEGDVGAVRAWLEATERTIFDFIRTGVIAGIGTGLANAFDIFSQSGQVMYAYKVMQIHSAITPRMRRYFNKLYYPNYPDMPTAFRFMTHGYLSEAQVKEAGQYDGWSLNHATQLLDVMYQKPTPIMGFYMWRKGLTVIEELKILMKIGGLDPEWHDTIIENWYREPSLMTLCRMSDLVSLGQTWTVKKLKAQGYRDEDISRLWDYLDKRPVRDELRAITSKWLWRFRMGRCSLDDLRNALIELELGTREIDLLMEKAVLDYQDELIDEQVEILIWKFRTGAIGEEEFKADLINLTIREEKANLIVELQKAMGYLGAY